MKSNLKIGDKVKDTDGDIAIVENIWEREEAPNQIEIRYLSKHYISTDIWYECDLEKIN